MTVAIIEDEAPAAERLRDLLHAIDPTIGIGAVLPTVRESVAWLERETPDLLLVDIHLADGSSFEIFRRREVRIPVIFTTAYDEYAIEAFRVNSIDYLLKPIRRDDLQRALEKFRSLRTVDVSGLQALLRGLPPPGPAPRKHFLIQIGQKLQQLSCDDIAYCYAMEKNTFCMTRQKQALPLDRSLDRLQEELAPEQFFRINRKMIVNMHAIVAMHAWSRSRIRLELAPAEPKGIEALVSVDRTAAFRAWLDQ
ncbi:MAG: response regulator transcription factor [Bacteroidetes bacterium]|nr:response regulator transcription factor [Bacteroidota bacterium]